MLVTSDVSKIASLLKNKEGAVIAYPTETFYGLGARISDHVAAMRIIQVKGRDAAKGMIILASDMEMVCQLAETDDLSIDLLKHFWPGPLSAVLRAREGIDPFLAPRGKVAVRISPNAMALSLIREAGPITSTSANISGRHPLQTPGDITAQDLDIDGILDGGKTPGGKPSTLIDLTVWPPVCLRDGAIPFETILP
jgi:L-threonylcarbamoyladenylate synthase